MLKVFHVLATVNLPLICSLFMELCTNVLRIHCMDGVMYTDTEKQHDNEVVEVAVHEGLQMEESNFCCDEFFI